MATKNEKETTIQPSCTPPKILERNNYGLLTNVNYIFDNETGLVDWRKMVKVEHLIPNKQRTQETDVTKLEDKDLLILLQGTKELAFLRGFTNIQYELVAASPTYCCAICRIDWIANYETENKEVSFESIGDAHYENTDSFAKNYLAAIAENRAFVRCVRNFLRIVVLSKEEIGGKQVTDNNSSQSDDIPTQKLQEVMDKHKITFEQLKDKMVKEKIDGAAEFKNIKDIPNSLKFSYVKRIKEKLGE
jgi:hypothetical protein